MLGLVVPVSVYCDWVRWKVWSATSISVWQHVKLSVEIHPWDTLACCWDVKQPTNIICPLPVFRLSLWLSTSTVSPVPSIPSPTLPPPPSLATAIFLSTIFSTSPTHTYYCHLPVFHPVKTSPPSTLFQFFNYTVFTLLITAVSMSSVLLSSCPIASHSISSFTSSTFSFSYSIFSYLIFTLHWLPRWPSGYGVRLWNGRSGVQIPHVTGFFRVESYQWIKNWHSGGYPARRLAL